MELRCNNKFKQVVTKGQHFNNFKWAIHSDLYNNFKWAIH